MSESDEKATVEDPDEELSDEELNAKVHEVLAEMKEGFSRNDRRWHMAKLVGWTILCTVVSLWALITALGGGYVQAALGALTAAYCIVVFVVPTGLDLVQARPAPGREWGPSNRVIAFMSTVIVVGIVFGAALLFTEKQYAQGAILTAIAFWVIYPMVRKDFPG